MSEKSMMEDLFYRINEAVDKNTAVEVVAIKVKIGALAEITLDRFRELFAETGEDTVVDGPRPDIEYNEYVNDPDAQPLLLKDVTVQ